MPMSHMTTFEDYALDQKERSISECMQVRTLTPLMNSRIVLAAAGAVALIKLRHTNFAIIHNIKDIFTGNIHRKLNVLEQQLRETEYKLLQSQSDTANKIRSDVSHGFGKIETQLQRQQFTLNQIDTKITTGFEGTAEKIKIITEESLNMKELLQKTYHTQKLSLEEQRYILAMLQQLASQNTRVPGHSAVDILQKDESHSFKDVTKSIRKILF